MRACGAAAHWVVLSFWHLGTLVPAPFPGEVIVLRRPKVGFELDGVQTARGK